MPQQVHGINLLTHHVSAITKGIKLGHLFLYQLLDAGPHLRDPVSLGTQFSVSHQKRWNFQISTINILTIELYNVLIISIVHTNHI